MKKQSLASYLDNFQVSRQINRCDSQIHNCSTCFLDYNNKLICITCIFGYIQFDGICYESQEQIRSFQLTFLIIQIIKNLLNSIHVEICVKLCKFQLGEYYCEQCYDADEYKVENVINYMCQIFQILYNFRNSAIPLSHRVFHQISKEFCVPFQRSFYQIKPYLQTTSCCLEGDCNNELTYEFIQDSCFFNRFPRTQITLFFNQNI
ncbi:unnamed protein product [Paramecium octaurelia]|uniref:Uncharacterized protein n=1 Tax=Paramecium octaurelia TaxID=43137 RepID=A0A8S1YKN8_PAROT|nr:unnamed protein product [Paramecium octaurelia]